MIKITCNVKETLNISELTEFQGDLKHRDDTDVSKIIKSIRKHGFAFPFFVWKHDDINHVFDGHGRLIALKLLQEKGEEIPPLPVVYVNAENEAEAKEMLLKLNSNYGHMTQESVLNFLDGLQIDFEDLELPEGEIDFTKLIEDQDNEDLEEEIPEVDEINEPDSVPGKIYQLGPHRLMCGDSTNIDDVAKLMDGVKADLIVTDPPYNVDYGGINKIKVSLSKTSYKGANTDDIANDHMEENAFIGFLEKAFNCMKNELKNGGVFYIWYGTTASLQFLKAMELTGLKMHQNLIWVKDSLCLGLSDWQWRHEPCFYGWKEGAAHFWEGRRDLTSVIDNKPNYKQMDKTQLIKEIERLRGENVPQTIIYEDKPKKNGDHPTMKPVPLFVKLIRNSSKEEDIVLDLFGGSGTTLIASAKLNRYARIMEYSPKYCDVIRKRWTKYAQENGLEVGSGGLE